MPRSANLLLLAAVICAAAGPASLAQFKARDKTVGACTRKAEFAKRQSKIDPLVQQLTAAPEAKKKKLGQAIARKYGRGPAIENLIRYREPDMKYVFLPLLGTKRWSIEQRALYGLKMVGDESVVPAVAKRLRSKDARLREMAANCLCHVGGEAAVEPLRKAMAQEKDAYARESMRAALRVIETDERPYAPWEENLTGPDGARRVSWAWTVKGKSSFNKYDAKTLEYPKAASFQWPISWYHDSLFMKVPRNSFGGKSGHAGEDMAWFREGCSVFAVADGLVRMVQGAGGTWGFIVVMEHKLASGDYVSSVYGHLAWDILVEPGDVVKRGQKIGTVGLSCAVENGGYGSHLHFGIADGPFRKPKGMYRDGTALNFGYKGKRVKAPVVGYVYLPDKKDENGFPGLGLKVEVPDGEVLTVAVGNVPMAAQVGWIAGYAKRCRGWYDPYAFIGERLPKD